MVSLKAPKITATQRKELEAHKSNLERAIGDFESVGQKAAELRKKEDQLEKKAAGLHRRAAAFELDAETELASTLKQVERVHDAIRELESGAHSDKEVNFRTIDRAQELIQRICQATYEQLLDQIGSALAPFYVDFNAARFYGRGAPAVNHLVTNLLTHRLSPADPVERITDAAMETLAKVSALLDGSEIWRYEGGETPEKQSA